MHSNKHQQHNIISLEDDAKVPDGYGLARFIEEINILELEGYYFCPNKTEAGQRKAGAIDLSAMTERPLTIVLSGYGQPTERAYKVLQAVFFKLTQQRYSTDGWVVMSFSELLALLGNSKGGRQIDEIYRAIKQLKNTEVNTSIIYKEKRGDTWEKKWRAMSFNIIDKLAFEGGERGRFSRIALKVDDLVLRNFQNRHVSYFNWERLQGLDMVGMMLYKRFFRHWANIYQPGKAHDKLLAQDKLVFDKDYSPICTTWLGLKPFTQESRIRDQLRSMNDLRARRLLRDWQLTRGKEGQWKVLAYPGAGFFADYESMYVRKQPTAAPAADTLEPLVYLHDFHKALGHEQDAFAPKEVAYARDLLARYGEAGVHDFMQFGLGEARKTNFDMQWFGALSLYESKWQATYQKKAKAQERQAAIASCPACNEVGMLEFEDGMVGQCPHQLQRIALIHRHKPIRGYLQG